MYQTQISTLHPPSRGDGSNIDLKSNLDNFYDEPEPLTDAEYDVLDARSQYLTLLALQPHSGRSHRGFVS